MIRIGALPIAHGVKVSSGGRPGSGFGAVRIAAQGGPGALLRPQHDAVILGAVAFDQLRLARWHVGAGLFIAVEQLHGIPQAAVADESLVELGGPLFG